MATQKYFFKLKLMNSARKLPFQPSSYRYNKKIILTKYY